MLKKIGFTLVVAVMLLMLVNCGGETTGEETEVRPNAPATEEDIDNAAAETPDAEAGDGDAAAETQEPVGDSEPVILSDAVAILVVDSFTANIDDPSADDTTDSETQNENCIVEADGQGVYAGQGAGVYAGQGAGLYVATDASGDYALIDTTGISHGDLVMKKFHDMLPSPSHAIEQPDPSIDGKDEWKYELLANGLVNPMSIWQYDEGPDLYLVQVDTQGFTTSIIAERIKQQMFALNALYGISRFVVNMSFAIVPCNPQIDLATYKADIEADSNLKYLEQIFGDLDSAAQFLALSETAETFYDDYDDPGLVLEFFNQDPLNNLFSEILDGYQVIGVAAAGQIPSVAVDLENSSIVVGGSGKLFPYAPALWENVLSVSVMVGVDEEHIIGDYSNDGEIGREDGIVTLDNPLIVWSESGITGTASIPYKLLPATSWATPEMSLAAAEHLRLGGAVECQNLRPPLAYAYSAPAWMNMPLQNAVINYCSSDWSGPTQ